MGVDDAHALGTHNIMDLYKFEDEQAVQKEADRLISKIFADKSYSNPEKLSLLLLDYQKKQGKLDAQLSKAIRSEIDCIKQSKESVLQANAFIKEADQKTQRLGEVWQQQAAFHHFMEDVVTLQTFQSNVGKVVEQLSYFIDMESQMQNLERMAEDESKYQVVAGKLLSLIQLRDALLEDSSWQHETQVMRKEFTKVNNFETRFFDKLFECFSDCIKRAKETPQTLRTAVQVVESYDNALVAKGKQRQLRSRAEQIIRQSIQRKFTEELSDADDLISMIQSAKFATKDLIDVNDYVQPCFPKEFAVMELYQCEYQRNIQVKIFPYFDQIQEEKQYGNLVILLGWIDDYESMLARAGLDSTKLTNLKVKVKILMPFFIDHNRRLVQDYIQGALALDKKKFGRKYYEELLRDGQDLISMFPSDIFRFINQEADVIKGQLKGQIFVEFVRCITEAVNHFQAQERDELQREWRDDVRKGSSEDQTVNFWYKVILYINNYNECLRHAGESKELFSECATEQFKSRIEKLFFNEVQKELNQSIPHFIKIIIQIIFTKVLAEYYPSFFTAKWLADKSSLIMSNIIKTVSVQLNDIQEQNLIINIIHHRMVVKESLQFIVNAYIEQLIILVKVIYKANNNMEINYCNYPVSYQKIQKEASVNDMKAVFNSKVAFTQAVKRDKMSFLKFADNYGECTSKAFMEKIKNKFVVLVDLFMKKGKEFQVLPAKVAQVFPEKASELLEAVLIVRDDVESRASTIPKRGMGYD